MDNFDQIEILLVEDSPFDAELTIRALKKRHFLNPIHTVTDGAEALDFLFCRGAYAQRTCSSNLRLILLDLKIPKINGFEVLQAIKKDDRTRKIPVVVLTSSREDPDIKKAYELGVNSYVVKPVNFENFSECVSNLGLYWLLVNQPTK